MFQIKFKVLHEDAKIPAYATPGSAGADLVSVEEVTIKPGHVALVSTGLAMEIPEGFEVQVRPRSGLAGKKYVTVINSPGTIDSDYRGEVKILLHNVGGYDYHVKPGDRIAQMVVAKVEQPDFIAVEELSDTERGEGGFGSTGVEEDIYTNLLSKNSTYYHIAKLAVFLCENNYKMSGDELVDFLNRNGIEKRDGGLYRKGRGIFKALKNAYDAADNKYVAGCIANAFTKKNGDIPWE